MWNRQFDGVGENFPPLPVHEDHMRSSYVGAVTLWMRVIFLPDLSFRTTCRRIKFGTVRESPSRNNPYRLGKVCDSGAELRLFVFGHFGLAERRVVILHCMRPSGNGSLSILSSNSFAPRVLRNWQPFMLTVTSVVGSFHFTSPRSQPLMLAPTNTSIR